MPELAVESLAPGGSRTFVFTALLPESAGRQRLCRLADDRALRLDRHRPGCAAAAAPANPDPPPRIRLRVPPIQRVVTRARFRAFARCNEACRITAYAKVPVGGGRRVRTRSVKTRRLRAHRRALLRIRLPRRSAASIGRSLRRRAPAWLMLTVIARDDAGNTRVVRRKVVFRPVSARRGR